MAQNQTHDTLVFTSMIITITIAILCGFGMAQSSSGCTNVIISMSPCLNYISGNSSTPSSGCCTQLASVVKSQPQCLCEVLNDGGSSLDLNINQTQALQLPKACNVQTPPTSQCNARSPGSSPTMLLPPIMLPPPTTPSNPSDSGRGRNTVPSKKKKKKKKSNSSSNLISTRLTIVQIIFSLLVVSYSIMS